MNVKWRHVLLPGLAVFFVFQTAQAQQIRNKFELGAGIGTYVYQGDLTPQRMGSLPSMRPGVNLFGSKILSPAYSVRLNLAIASLRGADSLYKTPAYRQERNLAFQTPLWEVSASFIWNIAQANYGGEYASRFAPYAGVGFGLARLRVQRDASGFNAAFFGGESGVVNGLNTDLGRRTPRLTPVIPLVLGARYAINDNWDVFAEANYRVTFTDYIDGFSRVANPKLRDQYYSVGIGIIRKFGRNSGLACPVVR